MTAVVERPWTGVLFQIETETDEPMITRLVKAPTHSGAWRLPVPIRDLRQHVFGPDKDCDCADHDSVVGEVEGIEIDGMDVRAWGHVRTEAAPGAVIPVGVNFADSEVIDEPGRVVLARWRIGSVALTPEPVFPGAQITVEGS